MKHALLITESTFRPNQGEQCIAIVKNKPGSDKLWPWIGYTDVLWMHVRGESQFQNIFGQAIIGTVDHPVSYAAVNAASQFVNPNNQQLVNGSMGNVFGGFVR